MLPDDDQSRDEQDRPGQPASLSPHPRDCKGLAYLSSTLVFLPDRHLPPQGPRYCPSIESKVIKHPQLTAHRIWLEPEGFDTDLVYPSGMSVTLPADVQERVFRTIKGLEDVKMVRAGYGVEVRLAM
jgi:hypothetical protein